MHRVHFQGYDKKSATTSVYTELNGNNQRRLNDISCIVNLGHRKSRFAKVEPSVLPQGVLTYLFTRINITQRTLMRRNCAFRETNASGDALYDTQKRK